MNKAEALTKIEELESQLADLENVPAIEAHGASIAIAWVNYPGGRVGLDAVGNMVRVEVDPSANGWMVTE